MKTSKLLVILFLMVGVLGVFGQAPQKFNYQAVARDNAGTELANQALGIKISIRQGSPTGIALYEESHAVTTSNIGLFNIEIGNGTLLAGSFSFINWANGPYFVEIGMDANGGTAYASLGTQQLLSVPYALYAETSGSGSNNDHDQDSTNELQTISKVGNTVTLSHGGGSFTDDNTLYSGGTGINVIGTIINNTGDTNPADDITTSTSASGDLAGTYPNPTVDGLQGIGVSGTVPTTGQVLKFNGTSWVPDADNGATYTAGTGISLAGNMITNTGDVNATDDVTTSTTAGGDLAGTYPNPSVDGLQGRTVAATVPTNGQVLTWNNALSRWEPAAVPAGSNWSIVGNAGTNAATNSIGTTDSVSFVVRANNQQAGRIDLPLESTFWGMRAGKNSTGFGNTGIGAYSMELNGTGIANTAVGRYALHNNGSGDANCALGFGSLSSNTTGTGNSAFGVYSLRLNTTGIENSAFGINAMQFNTTGTRNSAFGTYSLNANSTGDGNCAFGVAALYSNSSGSKGSAFGYQSMFYNTTGSENSAFGNSTLLNNTIGYKNSSFGDSSLYSNTNGYNNSAFGENALFNNTTGYYNSSFGANSMKLNTTGNENSAHGFNSLSNNTVGIKNSAFGYSSLMNNTSGTENASFGHRSLFTNSTGFSNSAFGVSSMSQNTTGYDNSAFGYYALSSNSSGTENAAFGYASLLNNTTGFKNSAYGTYTLYSNTTGYFNSAVGQYALQYNTTGIQNSAFGNNALRVNTIGYDNSAFGNSSMQVNISGFKNSAYGQSSLGNNTTGDSNSAFGNYSLMTNSAGGGNTGLGYFADVSSGSLYNSTAVGGGAIVNATSKVRIGNVSVSVIEGQVAYSWPSDARFKFNIQENIPGLDFINALKPITYQFDSRKFDEHLMKLMPDSIRQYRLANTDYSESESIIHSGFLAQDIETVCKQLGYEFDGLHVPQNETDNYSLAYSQFIMPLVKSVQEQQEMIEVLQDENDRLQSENQAIQNSLEEMQAQINELVKGKPIDK